METMLKTFVDLRNEGVIFLVKYLHCLHSKKNSSKKKCKYPSYKGEKAYFLEEK